jgi:surface protein
MFHGSEFNGDISQWNVANVTEMSGMFQYSKFKGDISQWDLSNVTDKEYMFDDDDDEMFDENDE